MKRFCKNIAVLFLLFGFVLTARADWRLVGDTAELKIPVVLSPVGDDGKEFVYVGGLPEVLFKLTDGITEYVHDVVVIIPWVILYLCERPVKTSEGCVSGMRARPMYID